MMQILVNVASSYVLFTATNSLFVFVVTYDSKPERSSADGFVFAFVSVYRHHICFKYQHEEESSMFWAPVPLVLSVRRLVRGGGIIFITYKPNLSHLHPQ